MYRAPVRSTAGVSIDHGTTSVTATGIAGKRALGISLGEYGMV